MQVISCFDFLMIILQDTFKLISLIKMQPSRRQLCKRKIPAALGINFCCVLFILLSFNYVHVYYKTSVKSNVFMQHVCYASDVRPIFFHRSSLYCCGSLHGRILVVDYGNGL